MTFLHMHGKAGIYYILACDPVLKGEKEGREEEEDKELAVFTRMYNIQIANIERNTHKRRTWMNKWYADS